MTKKKHDKGHEDQDKVKELTESLQRLQAEFENYKKRTAKECASVADYANSSMISKLLPVVDSFDLALKNMDPDAKEGVQTLYNQMMCILRDQGLEIIPIKGKFDPYMHEALLTEESDKEKNTILEELQKGFTFKGKVIRHSKVKVSR